MAYSTPDDVVAAWPKTTTSAFTDDTLTPMIARGDAIIDSFLARRYPTPITPAPPLLKMLSQDLAMLDVFDRAPSTPDYIIRRLDRDMEILRGLADGTLALVYEDGTVVSELDTGGVLSSTSDYTSTFGVAPSLAERVDPHRADDEADARDPFDDN